MIWYDFPLIIGTKLYQFYIFFVLNVTLLLFNTRRKTGAFLPTDPRSPEVDKGYRLRDTDDRLHRMKSQAKKHHSSFISMNNVAGNNGKHNDNKLTGHFLVVVKRMFLMALFFIDYRI